MATRKVTIELDEGLLQRARDHAGGDASDDEVVARAVAAFAGVAALADAQARGGLPDAEADELAVQEVRAYRASRDAAA